MTAIWPAEGIQQFFPLLVYPGRVRVSVPTPRVADKAGYARLVHTLPANLEPGLSREQSDGYQQSQPLWSDPLGDAHLIRLSDKVPKGALKAIWNHTVKGEKWDQREEIRQPHQIGKEPLLHAPELLERFQEAIQAEPGLTPHIGPEHKWSSEAQDYQRFGFWKRAGQWLNGLPDFPMPTLGASKLLVALAFGCTARFTTTGQEEALQARLLEYKDRSVGVEDMFRESYRLNEGDLYRTLLTAENILAHDPFDPRRSEQPLQKKLQYIRNDQPQVGDNFGAWYHLFGVATYGLMRPDWMAQSAQKIESVASYFTEGPDRQEDLINRLGADLGSGLKKLVA